MQNAKCKIALGMATAFMFAAQAHAAAPYGIFGFSGPDRGSVWQRLLSYQTQPTLLVPSLAPRQAVGAPSIGSDTDVLASKIVESNRANAGAALQVVRSSLERQGFAEHDIVRTEQTLMSTLETMTTADITRTLSSTTAQTITTLDGVLQKAEEIRVRNERISRNPFQALLHFFAEGIKPPTAYAQASVGLFRAGGMVLAAFPCTCDPAVWYVAVFGPAGGVFYYILGTQAFLWYNLPLPSIQFAGLFTPYVQGICWMGVPPSCVPIFSMGLITPIAGSSTIL